MFARQKFSSCKDSTTKRGWENFWLRQGSNPSLPGLQVYEYLFIYFKGMKKIYILHILFSILPAIWVIGQAPKNVQDFGPRRRLWLELGMGFGKNMLVNTMQLTKYMSRPKKG